MRQSVTRWREISPREIALAALLAIAVVIAVARLLPGPAAPHSVSISFDRPAYRPSDTIRLTIHDRQALPPYTRWTLDQQCQNPLSRGAEAQRVLRVVLHREGDALSLAPAQRARLMLAPGSHTLCLYWGSTVLTSSRFVLAG
jgi:hypothetical protein